MVRITIEDFVKATHSVYRSTVLAFKRARQLNDEGHAPTIEAKGDKITTLAIKEVILGNVIPCESKEFKVEE
ncbi:MAG TPA: DNA-directed RNA polymerase subunit omega [Firmicutes bacterium]|nr:DNA-directed RNA polymerase subunit omega [Bacillota bacterium]